MDARHIFVVDTNLVFSALLNLSKHLGERVKRQQAATSFAVQIIPAHPLRSVVH